MICPHCQHKIPDRAVYCGACGRRVIGWRGTATGKGGRPAADSKVETQPIPPDPRLLEAAGGEPAATRKIPPDSRLLAIVRGTPADSGDPLGDSRQRRTSNDEAARATPPPGASTPPGPVPPPHAPSPVSPARVDPTEQVTPLSHESTGYALDAAFQRGRSRLWVLLSADAVLLIVGVYLIASWALRPVPERAPPPMPPPQTGGGYIDWEVPQGGGRIATGPVEASFANPSDTHPRAAHRPPARPVMARRPHARPHPRPMRPRPEPHRLSIKLAPPPMRDLKAERAAFLKQVPGFVRRHQRRIRKCYEQVLRLIKTVHGDVDIEFVVAPDGRVTSAWAHRNSTGSKTLASCIAGVFLTLRLPAPPGGAVTLRYPFRFAPRR